MACTATSAGGAGVGLISGRRLAGLQPAAWCCPSPCCCIVAAPLTAAACTHLRALLPQPADQLLVLAGPDEQELAVLVLKQLGGGGVRHGEQRWGVIGLR